jgi:hypothetical protein
MGLPEWDRGTLLIRTSSPVWFVGQLRNISLAALAHWTVRIGRRTGRQVTVVCGSEVAVTRSQRSGSLFRSPPLPDQSFHVARSDVARIHEFTL